VYEGTEAQLRLQVAAWFAHRGVELEASPDDPHCLTSREKEQVVGVVKGEYRVADSPTQGQGESATPTGMDAEWERARTDKLDYTSRSAAREFATQLAKTAKMVQSQDLKIERYDTWAFDRPAYVDRDAWEACFTPIDGRRIAVRILRRHASDWGGAADKSFIVAPTVHGERAGNSAPSALTLRDAPAEAALAEFLDFSAVAEVAGTDALGASEEPRVALPEAPTPAAPAPPQPCGAEVQSDVLEAGGLLLLSDPAGSQETAEAFDQLVCSALSRGLEVSVALSVSAAEQQRLNTYLDSSGTAEDRAALLRGRFWSRLWQDGRSSEAVMALLERLRLRRAQRQSVAVLAADVDLRGNVRTAFISATLLEHHRQYPTRLVLGLFSNTQASQRAGSQWDSAYLPVGYRLAAAGVPVRSFDVSYLAGFQWTCRVFRGGALRCGTWPITPGPKQRMAGARPGLNLFSAKSDEGFDGLWFIGRLSASPPALAGRFKDEGDSRGHQLQEPVRQGRDVGFW
jgi:hypothetical protein